jgi:hypothetical protein
MDWISSNILPFSNVALCLINTILAILYLAKDWEAHKKSWRRVVVLCLIVLTGLGAAINTIYQDKKTEEKQQADKKQIATLQQSVLTANKNQQDNTEKFLTSFDKMSLKLVDLQTQLDKAGLQKEAAQLKEELTATKKALTPPKAALTFSLIKPLNINALPVQTVTLPVKNGVVHVELHILNQTDITALDGDFIIEICNKCKFASEPSGFTKLSGMHDVQRSYSFNHIWAKSVLKTLSIDILIAPYISSFEFDFHYRCSNCVLKEEPIKAHIICSR